MTTPPPFAAVRLPASAGPPLVPSRSVLMIDPTAQPLTLERAGVFLGFAIAVWGVARWVVRPFFDDLTLASWKRKRPEVEQFMRDEIFRLDIEKRRASDERLDRALVIAKENADSISNLAADIARVASEQRAMTTVLAGIPLIAASIESVNDALADLGADIKEANAISRDHGERIATLSALIGEETPGRRHHTRRATDPHLVDPTPKEE